MVTVIVGTGADDTINGTPGPDLIFGLLGRNTIDGLGGNDLLYGGSGIDILTGSDGDDTLFGGASADIFEFDDDDTGTDRIADWTDGVDRIDLEDFDLGPGRVLAAGRQVGDDVRFTFDSTVIVVSDAELANFGNADFIF